MNLYTHLINTIRTKPMKLPAIIKAINAEASVKWTPDFLTQQVELAYWRGHIVRDEEGKFSVPAPKEKDDLGSPQI
jgi:hypothetical protein